MVLLAEYDVTSNVPIGIFGYSMGLMFQRVQSSMRKLNFSQSDYYFTASVMIRSTQFMFTLFVIFQLKTNFFNFSHCKAQQT